MVGQRGVLVGCGGVVVGENHCRTLHVFELHLCTPCIQLFKGVAERGRWTRMMEDAERSYMAGDLDSALVVYLLLAEMGLEVAQTNAAYILEQGQLPYCVQCTIECIIASIICNVVSKNFYGDLHPTDGVSLVHENETMKRALILWNRSASQGT